MKTELSPEVKQELIQNCIQQYRNETGKPARDMLTIYSVDFVEWLCIHLGSYNFAKQKFNGDDNGAGK